MAKKRKRTQAEDEAWDERTRRIDERLGGIFATTTFDERTHMIEARIAELEARAATKARGQS